MEGLTFSASHQGNSPELRTASPVPPNKQPTKPSTSEAVVRDQTKLEVRAASGIVHVEAQGSAFQARLNYDRDKATVFVEILDPSNGDVIQRIPAETAADWLRELTGGHGGTVVDKIA